MKEKEIENKFYYIIWIIYGVLFGPIEFFVSAHYGNGSIFKIALFVIIIPFLGLVAPMIINSLFKKVKKEIFTREATRKVIYSALVSITFVWLGIIIYSTYDEGIVSMLITCLFLVILIEGVSSAILWGIYSIVYPEGSSLNYGNNNDIIKDMERTNACYDKNFRVTTSSSIMYDKYGNQVGTADTVTFGDWKKETTYYDNFGNELGKKDEHKF